jgi:hypothetical protein
MVAYQEIFAGEYPGLKNGNYHTQDVKHRCETKLGIQFKPGGEFNGWFKDNNIKVTRITIPKGRKPIPPKTYKSMARQLKLTTEEFDEFLDCPIKLPEYREILKGQNSLPSQQKK